MSEKITQLIDKRINTEINRVNKAMNEHFDTIRADMSSEIDTLTGKMNSLSDTMQMLKNGSGSSSTRAFNVVIRKLPESVNEQLETKVNGIIKDHLGISNITVKSVKKDHKCKF
ncbi:hypothetical protein DPMN_149169 [Dreissena polymorpha]|uniref:Uncharacterized protein n=1 Tax=Dreissena polymorpha TaxID=45954 RepID=A0A9D4FD93_DREPO|nr:hypothetical protein DPMN_149169 [Dreissena polymorpha]